MKLRPLPSPLPCSTQGLTLVEVLVAGAISLIVGMAVISLLTSSQRVTDQTINQASRLDDLQSLAALIGDDVRSSRLIFDNLNPPTWTGYTGTGNALNLTVNTPGCTLSQVSYVLVSRQGLTSSTDEWLRLAPDEANTSRQALLRVAKCDLVVTTRLVADYLDSVSFALARVGEATFSATPTTATAGVPYQSVRLNLAAARTYRGKESRMPSTGTLSFISTSRVVK